LLTHRCGGRPWQTTLAALGEADENELIEVFDAFDVCATYTKPARRLELAATVAPKLVGNQEKMTAQRGGR
jgi:hypothetical protein